MIPRRMESLKPVPLNHWLVGACCGDSGVPGRRRVRRLALAQQRDRPGNKGKPVALIYPSGGGHHRGSGHSPLGLPLPPDTMMEVIKQNCPLAARGKSDAGPPRPRLSHAALRATIPPMERHEPSLWVPGPWSPTVAVPKEPQTNHSDRHAKCIVRESRSKSSCVLLSSRRSGLRPRAGWKPALPARITSQRREAPRHAPASSGAAPGRVKQKVLPCPRPCDSTQMRPPCTSTTRLTTASPIPVPSVSASSRSNRPKTLS